MEIQRNLYLQELINRMHNGLIKVVTGVRRCGKSYLLFTLFKKYLLKNGVMGDNIICIELDRRENRFYRDPDKILQYIKEKIQDKENYFILLDEVQMLHEFEEVLNSLLHMNNVDIYVTGSNSKFLSRDVITEFRGRGDEIHMFPLVFREFITTYQGDIYHAWTDYMTYGGLPLITSMTSESQKIRYLTNLFTEVYLKDIIERNRIEKTQELADIVNILASAVGSLTNPSRIEATFKSIVHSSISANTISQYIEYLEDAYIINGANRYDVKGRKYIGTPRKYYFEDIGLRNARLGFRQMEETHLMENIVYNELRARGYSVDIGVVQQRYRDQVGRQGKKQLEIDFVANLGSRRYYIQSAFTLSTQEKRQQEKASLINVQDSFKKIILVKDVVNISRDEDGITIMSIFDFLQNENSLDF